MSMKAREIISQLVTENITPVLKTAGFKKTGFNFMHQHGETVQVVNVQLAGGNFDAAGSFYINVGINFERVCALEGKEYPTAPKEYQCRFRRRLEEFIQGAPERWAFADAGQAQRLAEPLKAAAERLCARLNKIDSVEAFLGLDELKHGTELGLLAQMRYLTGDVPGAVQALQAEQEYFSDRPNWSIQDKMEALGLNSLAPDFKQGPKA